MCKGFKEQDAVLEEQIGEIPAVWALSWEETQSQVVSAEMRTTEPGEG